VVTLVSLFKWNGRLGGVAFANGDGLVLNNEKIE